MVYEFDISQLHILSILVFDASIEPDELKIQPNNGQLNFSIERRTFEAVKRSKWLFWNRTKFNGKSSRLQLNGVANCNLLNLEKPISGNDFINNFKYDGTNNLVELTTALGRVLRINPETSFMAKLEDLTDSDFGKGTSSGKLGFTEHEWLEYLKKEGINAM
ncbi:hypothetical protein [Reichenbachiella sp. MALMAid0571]|uniref:hypothetical protein n=1 Tax=Reichenbachiella sp. MALMAid0571 TaxID=3143939 RepID=UPI0032DF979D